MSDSPSSAAQPSQLMNIAKLVGRAVTRAPDFIAELLIVRLTSLMLVAVLSVSSVGSTLAIVIMIYRETMGLAEIAINHPGYVVEDVATAFTIAILSLIDLVLIAGVLAMVNHGSYIVYVKPAVKSVFTGEPLVTAGAFKNLSSGLLKEKVLSTIKIASAIFLFRQIIAVGASPYPTWEKIVMIAGYHLLFIIGYAVMSWANNKHDAVTHAAPQPPHDKAAHEVTTTTGTELHDPAANPGHGSDHDLPKAA